VAGPNNRGVVVCRPRYFALPERADPEWEAAERRTKGDVNFDIAQGELWQAPTGRPFCPLFAEHVREVAPWRFEGWYVRDAPAVFRQLVVIRGFDGGLHRPCLILAQYDQKRGILWVIREFRPVSPIGTPIDMQASEFVAACRYLCGQATLEQLRREEMENRWSTAAALAWIDQERRNPFYGWEMPWIPTGSEGVRFVDVMMAHEAKRQDQLAPARDLNSLKKLYYQQGLALRGSKAGWDHRELALDFLLREGPIPGLARLLIDSSCKTLLRGLCGLEASKPGAPKPYVEDRYLEDAVDAFLNAMCAAFPLEHASRLARLDAQHAEARALANGEREPSDRWLATPAGIASPAWANLRNNYRET
jgi:hypothetical protein